MRNLNREIGLVRLAATLIILLGVSRIASAGSVYDAVADFSISANPNGQWSYLYDIGPGPQLLTQSGQATGVTGVIGWGNGLAYPNIVSTEKNTTNSSVSFETIVLPPNLLLMDPEAVKSDITRFTAPSAGTWSISGLFQGIDLFENSHNVEILENSTTMLLAPTSISSYGQTVNFSADIPLAKGDTIDFIVHGATNYNSLSTGLSATIRLSSVPEPSSMVLCLSACAACGVLYWRLCQGLATGRRNASRGWGSPKVS